MFEATITLKEAMQIYEKLPEVVQSFLQARAGNHGIAAHELLQKIPKHLLDNNVEIFNFVKSKDISHIIATSKGGSSNHFSNWIFEDIGPNRARGDDPMGLQEYLQAQLDNNVDAMGIEFGTADPGSPGYNAAFKQAFNVDSNVELDIDPDLISDTLNNAAVTSDGLWDGMGEALTEIGIPIGYLTFKVGFGGVIPFLRSINWRQLADLDGVDRVIRSDLLDWLAATDRLHGDSSLEFRTVSAALAHEWEPPFRGGTPPQRLTMGPVQKNQTSSMRVS